MKDILSQFEKNIISWYPIERNKKVLEIENSEEIVNELKNKTSEIKSISLEQICDANENNFDYVVLIGTFEKLNSEEEILNLLDFSKKSLKKDGKILLAMQNKFGMKYWTGESINNEKPYLSIVSDKENILGLTKIKNILNNLNLKFKIYYSLPDYKLTNVIFTDDFMPDNESIDARDLSFVDKENVLNFSERDAYKQILKDDKNMFPFFANSFFIEIANNDNFEDVKFVSFGITRKKEYRIKTIIKNDYVYKYANDNDLNHIQNILKNINILKQNNIEVLGEFKNNGIESVFLKQAKSLDKVLMEIYFKDGLEKTIKIIEEFRENILNKLLNEKPDGKDIFEKYEIKLPVKLKEKMHFTKNGILDLIFQNCLIKDNILYAYDQEWYEENVPIEFILYRAIIYFTELRNNENIDKIFELLNLNEYVEYFEILENKIQEKLVDQDMWKLHVETIREIGNTREILDNYKKRLSSANTHIQNLENNVEEYKKGIDDLTKLVQDKDVQLVDYANQLRAISNSLSWKITKPVRIFTWMFNPFNGATFIDRIMPPGGRRRIEYDKKQTEKKYAKKVENYFKLSDDETAEYWKGIDHRKYLKYEKDLKRAEEDEEYSDYEKWIKENTPSDQEIEKQEKTRFRKRPKISIVVPLYNTDTEFFRELLYTVHSQTYKKWELCLADGSEEPLEEIKSMVEKDKRIKYKFLGENKGIAENTNRAIEMATGDFISLLDHDDMLDISALYEVVKVINENKNVDFIYTDEDKFHFIDEPYFAPHFKPDFAPDTLRANNYICHFSVFKKELLKEIGGFNSDYNGAQDFDIILRMSEKAKKIVHIPKVLYHWRIHKGSTSMTQEAKPYAIDAGKRAIEAHLERIGLKGQVSEGINSGTYKIDYEVIGNPKVSILIPNKDEEETLKTCINSILNKTTYSNYEIIIIENNSKTDEIFDYYKELLKSNKIKILNYNTGKFIENEKECSKKYSKENERENLNHEFNYSSIINFGVKNIETDFVVQLNNDTELITPDWLEKMIGFCQRDDVGACGAKLYYPDDTIQHAGIIIGCRTVAAHVFRGLPKNKQGYFGRENLIQNMNAVTAACMMVKKSTFEEVGYMNEDFAVAFNDIDFCLKIRNTGKLIVYNPFVEFWHYESKTRGNDNAPDKIERFQKEINLFLETWKEKLASGDEYYNKNLSLDSDQYDIKINDKNV